MKVSKIMQHKVSTVHIDDPLAQAARPMWEQDIGCVPVLDGGGSVVGMLTDRDICMHAYLKGGRLEDLRVRDAMAKRVLTVTATDTIQHAELIMQRARIRRLPVVDDDGTLIGILSLNDIAREAAQETSGRRREINLDEVGMTLAEVCQPRAVTAQA